MEFDSEFSEPPHPALSPSGEREITIVARQVLIGR